MSIIDYNEEVTGSIRTTASRVTQQQPMKENVMQHDNSTPVEKDLNNKAHKMVSYLYDGSLNANRKNLNEIDEFEVECTLESLLIFSLMHSGDDLNIWLKPNEWIKVYYNFSSLQMDGILLLSQAWSNINICVFDLMKNYDFDKLTKKQSAFLNILFKDLSLDCLYIDKI